MGASASRGRYPHGPHGHQNANAYQQGYYIQPETGQAIYGTYISPSTLGSRRRGSRKGSWGKEGYGAYGAYGAPALGYQAGYPGAVPATYFGELVCCWWVV